MHEPNLEILTTSELRSLATEMEIPGVLNLTRNKLLTKITEKSQEPGFNWKEKLKDSTLSSLNFEPTKMEEDEMNKTKVQTTGNEEIKVEVTITKPEETQSDAAEKTSNSSEEATTEPETTQENNEAGTTDTQTDQGIVDPDPANHARHGRLKHIQVFKDGEMIKELDGLVEAFKWAHDNGIANQGWIKESLKTGRETTPGRKFKEGGYKFQYAEEDAAETTETNN